jgi:hypothetical protein
MAANLAYFKPIEGPEYVFVGCNDNDPYRRSGAPFLRRVRWNVWLADERIVPAAHSSVHCGSPLCMKRDALVPLSLVERKDRPRKNGKGTSQIRLFDRFSADPGFPSGAFLQWTGRQQAPAS